MGISSPTPPLRPSLPSASKEIYLARRPEGLLSPSADFGLRTSAVPAALPPGTALVRLLFVSVDPAMRGWMADAKSYIAPVKIGAVMRAAGVGEVVRVARGAGRSLHVGDVVSGMLGWREFGVFKVTALEKVDMPVGLSVSHALGVLGGTGMTAWFGLFEVGRPKKGDVVVVSAAAGATGSVAAQLAKRVAGCTVIGIAGGKSKCDYLVDALGLDGAVDYKADEGVDHALKAVLAGRTIDIYFDNVGGVTLDAVLRRISIGARIVLCGAIGNYNVAGGPPPGPRNIMQLLTRRARMQGLIVFDYVEKFGVARKKLAGLVAEGTVIAREDVTTGLEQAPSALLGLFEGRNTGKVVVHVADSMFGHERPVCGRSDSSPRLLSRL